jgi:hypothetical protein
MAHALDVEAVETWFRLQTAAMRWLDDDLAAGRITEEQLCFISEWLTNLDRYEPAEAVALLTAWEEWVTPAA